MGELILQPIIGTDKKSPLLSVCQEKDSTELHVYYGAQFLEAIPSDPTHINYRAAVGRLYNAGLSRKKLQEVFKVDRKTLQRWGEAILLDDCEETIRILSGRAHHKLSPEIRRFIEVRYTLIIKRNRYSYNKEIREDVHGTYGVDVSAETIRKVINSYKQRLVSEGRTEETILDLAPGSGESDCDDDDESEGVNQRDRIENHRSECPEFPIEIPNASPSVKPNGVSHIHHAGILVFFLWFEKLYELFDDSGHILAQWLTMLLLESVNIEQSKYLDFDSLSLMLGKTYNSPLYQRQRLQDLSNEASFIPLYRLNAQLVGLNNCSDFYYDPHTKHYTGMNKILKGWCPCIRFADKALHCDMIHSSKGEPVYIKHFDNYYDLRERFAGVLGSFRNDVGIATDKKLTMILDRGIYDQKLIQHVKDEPYLELITWEKGFKEPQKWDIEKCDGHFILVRYRNNSNDKQHYHFYYHDERWSKNSSIRRLIVHAINPQNRCITVSIICTDLTRDAQDIIRLIFSRWCQENDFKYLEKHFGLNQITSYAVFNYAQLRDTLEDKVMIDAEYKAEYNERSKAKTRLKNQLHHQHILDTKKRSATQQLNDVEQQLAELSSVLASEQSAELREQLKALKHKRRTLKAKLGKWNKCDYESKINQLDEIIKSHNQRLSQMEKNKSKLDILIKDDYKRLDTRKKNMMDILRIYARNLFYTCFQPFKLLYDNFRDDHAYFRNLTHADGFVEYRDNEVIVSLNPTAYLQPKMKKIMQRVLEKINQKQPILLDGSKRKIVLKLFDKEGFQLAI